MRIDLGDAFLDLNLRVKGFQRIRVVWHIGAVLDSTPADRVIQPPPYSPVPEKVDAIMDLMSELHL